MKPMTLNRTIRLSVRELPDGRFALAGFNESDMNIPVGRLKEILFFSHFRSFLGLDATADPDAVILTPREAVEALGGGFPLVSFVGASDHDGVLLQNLMGAAEIWNSPGLPRIAGADGGELNFTDDEVTEGTKAVLENAFRELLADGGIGTDRLKDVIEFRRTETEDAAIGETLPFRIAVRLSEPEESHDEWMLETVLVNKRGGTHWTPAARKTVLHPAESLPKKWKEFADPVAAMQDRIAALLGDGEGADRMPGSFISEPLEDAQVRRFLAEDLPVLQSLGIDVIIPAWLRDAAERKVRVRATTSAGSSGTARLDDALDFNWSFSLGGEEIPAEHFRRLVEEKREFIRAGEDWFRLDAAWLARIREMMEEAERGGLTVKDLLFRDLEEELGLAADVSEDEDDDDDPLFAFSLQQSLKEAVGRIRSKEGIPSAPVPAGLHATLRPYQKDGFDWLVFMRENGFGAILADDMGLGKTVQLIAYLLHLHETEGPGHGPSLIICPTSVIGNWQRELARFAPGLPVLVHYGQSRLKDESLDDGLGRIGNGLVLTTYGTFMQDSEALSEFEWASVTLDEAQNIKNMQTKQSRAIRKLHGRQHIALTGTPVENRLAELWAIFDFIHKGYLGRFASFQEEFINPIEKDGSEPRKQKLRAKIAPFLLRRTKSDPELMLNLPDKLEENEYVPLTEEQAALYESYIRETKAGLMETEGFRRKGIILKMLSRLKQLCNHPSLFLKEPFSEPADLIIRSKKLERIIELTAEIAESGEQVLIFTQYIGMGELIRHCLSGLHGIEAPFLTGSMPKTSRDRLVEDFQNGEFPVFILSLKAGGTGLNLTGANHVLHADRWWNPAVENQATDRAYRIGQERFVHVRKFVTIGTVEEKIDRMIAEKAALSSELIQSGAWITDLTESELDDLFTIG
ncbi:DEAD/DEAH box helicase [Edaphobacillus lindanitolerans]|uniref:Helicase conserved C-terminal domain-containing protein n=1 Tax=Edaphobacillus lindanitolerans TaxID=550447 RepID=A0A1U7PJ71_9BACI|nr:DEAD/DEAH box helicase [Edaphobacillus lindanitolerans]SIT69376.1 Helicase conserved C-terminal domain-containing protein [Edaphobacillus lindanitolerans]